MPIVNGVDLPDFQMISVLCANKMIKKSKEKGNTWRDLKYVRHDEFLYEALLDHANRITIPDRLVDWNHTGAYEIHQGRLALDKTIGATVDVMNFGAMIIENAIGAHGSPYVKYILDHT